MPNCQPVEPGPDGTTSCELRMLDDTEAAILWTEEEISRARAKFPSNENLLAALMEEVGELAKALIEKDEDWRDEALQVACVAIRIATEGDPQFPFTEGE